MTNTHTLLTALAALKGKQPHEVWPEWYGERIVCPKCKERGTVMTTFGGDAIWCRECDGQVAHGKRVHRSKFPEAICHTGPDIYAPDATLDDLLRVADWANDGPVALEWLPLDKEHYTEVEGCGSTGPTRQAAVRNALKRAAGVGG